MKRIFTDQDKTRCLDILTDRFADVPGVRCLFGTRKPDRKRLVRFFGYCLTEAISRNGAYMSSDGNAVLFFYRLGERRFSLKLLFWKLYLIIGILGPVAAIRAAGSRRVIDCLRPKEGLYAWFLASARDARSIRGLYELRKHMFTLSDELRLPVYAETTTTRNLALYLASGFRLSSTVPHPYGQFNIHLLKREPS